VGRGQVRAARRRGRPKRDKDQFKQLELSHFQSSFWAAGLDGDYVQSCRRTVEQEVAMGLDGRTRSIVGNHVLRAAAEGDSRAKHRFSSGNAIERAMAVSQFITLDLAQCAGAASGIGRPGSGRPRPPGHRRGDRDFASAIGAVVGAIKEASKSLSTNMRDHEAGRRRRLRPHGFPPHRRQPTLRKRVDAAGAATEELSQSIEHIGQQANPRACRWRSPRSAIRDAPSGDSLAGRGRRAHCSVVGLHFHDRVADQPVWP